MNRNVYFKYEIPRMKWNKCPCFQSDHDTEKVKLKTTKSWVTLKIIITLHELQNLKKKTHKDLPYLEDTRIWNVSVISIFLIQFPSQRMVGVVNICDTVCLNCMTHLVLDWENCALSTNVTGRLGEWMYPHNQQRVRANSSSSYDYN